MIALTFPPDPRVYRGEPVEVVADLMARSSGYSGDRSRLGPFCAWLASRTATAAGRVALIDPALSDDDASCALLLALSAVGAAVVVEGSRP